jgi:hypothetical protein
MSKNALILRAGRGSSLTAENAEKQGRADIPKVLNQPVHSHIV